MKILSFGILLVLVALPNFLTTKAQQIGTVEMKGQITVDFKESEDKFYAINTNFGCILPSFDSADKTFISAKVVSKLSFSNVLAIENNTDKVAGLTGYDYTIFANQKLENEVISENKIQSIKDFEAVNIPAKNLVNIPKNGAETKENKIESSEIKKSFATNTVLSYQVGISGSLKGDPNLKLKADPKVKLECGVIFSYLFEAKQVGGFAWEDINANGVQDIGEPPISEIEVNLYDEKCQKYIAKTVTESAGYYKFDKLENKKYCLKLIPNSKYTPTKKVGSLVDNNNSKLELDWKILAENPSLEYDFGLIQNKIAAPIVASAVSNFSTSVSSSTISTVCEECELEKATSKKPVSLVRSGGFLYFQWFGIASILALILGIVATKTNKSKSRELVIIKKD